MPSSKRIQLLLIFLLSIALISGPATRRSKAQAGLYSIVEIGTLGGNFSKAMSITNNGKVVGQTTTSPSSSSTVPFIWIGGSMTNITNFGGTNGIANAAAEIGYVVGAADGINSTNSFIWSDIFGKKDLGSLGGLSSFAFDINNAFQIVGQTELTGPGVLTDRAFVWDNVNLIRAIPTLGGNSNAAYGINSSGQIVGHSITTSGVTHAFILSQGVLTDLGTLGGTQSIAHKVNDSGHVVGYSTLTSGSINPPFHAFVWTANGGMTDLGALAGNRSIAYDINNAGEIVGSSEVAPGVTHAFIHSPLSGMLDLNNALVGSGWTLQEARGINDRGQIVGFGINPSGFTRGFLLTPMQDEIPGGEPPPCGGATANPIVLPPQTPMPEENLKPNKRSKNPPLRISQRAIWSETPPDTPTATSGKRPRLILPAAKLRFSRKFLTESAENDR